MKESKIKGVRFAQNLSNIRRIELIRLCERSTIGSGEIWTKIRSLYLFGFLGISSVPQSTTSTDWKRVRAWQTDRHSD